MIMPSVLRLMWLWIKVYIAWLFLSLLWVLVMYPIIKLIDWVYYVTRSKVWTYILSALLMIWIYLLIDLII